MNKASPPTWAATWQSRTAPTHHQVRIVVGIAGVDNEHLAILSKIAIIFSDEAEAQKMLDASTVQELYDLLGDVNAD